MGERNRSRRAGAGPEPPPFQSPPQARPEQASPPGGDKYRMLVESAQDSIFIIDRQGVIQYVNAFGAGMFRRQPEQIVGRSVTDVFGQPDAARMTASIASVIERGQPMCFPSQVSFPAGRLWLETWLIPHKGPNGEIESIIGVSRDITRREELSKANELLRDEIIRRERIEQGLRIQRDLMQRLGSTSDLNDAFEQILDAAMETGLADCGGIYLVSADGSLDLAAHRDLSEEFIRQVSRYAPDAPETKRVMLGKPFYFDAGGGASRYVAAAGLKSIAVIPVSHQGSVVACFNLASRVHDVVPPAARELLETIGETIGGAIARIRAEEQLRRNEERMRLILEHSSDGINIAILDRKADTRRLVMCNGRYVQMSGRSREELLAAADLNDLVTYQDPPERRREWRDRLVACQPYHGTASWKRPDGRENYYEWTAAPILLGPDRYMIIGVDRDVTERMLGDRALRGQLHFLQTLIDAIPLPVYYKDVQGRYLGCNTAFAESVSLPREQIIGKSAADIVPLEAAKVYEQRDRELFETGQIQSFEYRKILSDGTAEDVIIQKAPFRDVEGKLAGLVGTVFDITERKRAEEELRIAYGRLRALFDHRIGAIGIVIANAEGDILQANDYYLDMLGRTREELLSGQVRWRDMTPPEWLPADERAIAQLRERGVCDAYEKEYVRRDGTRVPVLLADTMLPGEGGSILAFVLDITERKRAEEARHQSEAKYRALIEQLPAITYVAALDDTSTTLYVSPQVEAMLGFSQTEYADDPNVWYRQTHPEDRDRVIAEVRQAVAGDGKVQSEYRMHARDGRLRWWRDEAVVVRDQAGQPLFLQGIMVDVTERKVAEEALQQSEARNRAMLQAIPDMMAFLGRDGVYLEVFPLHGFVPSDQPEKHVGKNINQVLGPKLGPQFADALNRVFATGQVQLVEYQTRMPGGEIRDREARLAACDPEKSLMLIRDVTERKRAERQLLANQQQLRSLASELSLAEERERRRIAAELHDRIGQALALTKIKLGMLGPALPDARNDLEEIARLVEQTILDTRTLTFELSPPVLYELGFEPAAEWLTEQIRRQYGIQTEFRSDGKPKPLADDLRVLLFGGVRELLVNAAKHARARRVAVAVSRQDKSIRIDVQDDGVGFDVASVQANLNGGFGLFSLRERLGHLGGQLLIDSQPGQGSRLTLLAPLSTRERKKRAKN